ncbi:MAG: DegV family protein [Chloroflexi bacterium]|nr:DegV family protein [Chloroflexota bacterium]
MSKPVAVVTDSTATIPESLVRQYNITVVPLQVIWGTQTYLDGVDITPEEFYRRLRTAKELPTTSQPSAGAFAEVYQRLHDQGYDILAVLISSKLSGTIASAEQAKDMVPEARVEIVDSLQVGMSLGFQAVAAARAAAEGADLMQAKAVAEQARDRSGVLLLVETLEYLHRGGRIGGASRLFGSMLNIKPILEVQNGRVEPVEKVRSRKKALKRLVALAVDRIGGRQPVRVAVLHADAEEEAQRLLDMLKEHVTPVEEYITPASPTVGVHVGPGTVGITYLAGM